MSAEIKVKELTDLSALVLDIPALNDTEFLKRVVNLHAIIRSGKKDLNSEENQIIKKISRETLAVFQPEDGLQLMLAAQMSAVHDLQQKMTYLATLSSSAESMNSYINGVTKLSNVFIQQANALAKLQGRNQQKVVVEHVNVHAGGQAIVGMVAPVGGGKKKKS